MLQDLFVSLVSNYTIQQSVVADHWSQLSQAYTHQERHYHNLQHLEQAFTVLAPVRKDIQDWDSLAFAVFYHDAVYDVVEYVTANDNEDKSAALAEDFLRSIGYPDDRRQRVKNHILATKKHESSNDSDTNFLSDADLYILGASWPEYEVYMKAIRKEYAIFPDGIYQAGRQKVLSEFLRAEPLYKTPHFQATYGAAARENLARELEIISFY